MRAIRVTTMNMHTIHAAAAVNLFAILASKHKA